MKTSCKPRLIPLLGALAALLVSSQAAALRMSVYVYDPYQVSNGSVVAMGHAVSGYTDFNKITVGGTYVAQCAHPQMQSTDGQRTESSSGFLGGISLTVTIPKTLPAYVGMPGFGNLARGTVVNCTYRWTARVVEGGYKIGTGGVGVGIGDGESNSGSTREFVMQRPSLNDEEPSPTCLP